MASSPVEYYAHTINISQGGMLFYTIARFDEKTKCHIKFKSNRMALIEREGVILRIVKEQRPEHLKENEVMYALEFETPFTPDQLFGIINRSGS